MNGKIFCAKVEDTAIKANHADFKATDGWFSRWKVKNRIVFTKLAREAAEADVTAEKHFMEQDLLEKMWAYQRKDIFNVNETGIYFRALPSTMYMKTKKGCKGFKTAKDRLNALVTCAMDGST